MEEFVEFPKIPRLFRDIVVTEKIDGTNAQIYIADDGQIVAGSRSRWLTPGKQTDNYGFAAWVEDNKEELLKLGPGRHYGEWWGLGIQRGYGLKEKRFSLFNIDRWGDDTVRPACCSIVPVLYMGTFDTFWINECVGGLRRNGSKAAPGFMRPEGIVVWHSAARILFKRTLENDGVPKSKSGEATELFAL